MDESPSVADIAYCNLATFLFRLIPGQEDQVCLNLPDRPLQVHLNPVAARANALKQSSLKS
jgi:hypothetical protein